ncbi:hypothetical protein PR202_ga05842 [Eleusine coracana subsp. coracana]|uniref:Reverse transcriptase domain-containing protein n=1 Tax=Eleusine coracana subsp. coracana TaxID=191504 RepID=A0AAV5BWV7_ELECO|nr:hypothetical protein PR202_ga05842 [Eleusine coracana subsp. coracana]
MLKLDITKAFDSVSWPFLLEILDHLGFGRKWKQLITGLLATSSTRVLLNSVPRQPIRHQRGLRQGDLLSPMLFVLATDVLSRLFLKAEEMGLLQPLATRALQHRLSLYADDAVMFVSPRQDELQFVKALLHKFGVASGLKTNMSKSSAIAIRCEERDIEVVQQHMECALQDFPCRYLGLPLSLRRLNRNDLQPYLDKIMDMLPGWKASLMARSGRLILVKVILTTLPIHLLITLDVPKWFIDVVDKWRRRFLWRGRQELNGGHCPVAWRIATKPLHLGGLGIHDLWTLAWALRMRWLWLEKTQPDRPWSLLKVTIPALARDMFQLSLITNIGDGVSTLFWCDRWLQGKSIPELAPDLMPFVRRRGWQRHTVRDALHNHSWINDVIGGLSVQATWQLLQLCDAVDQAIIQEGQPNEHKWLPAASGKFTTKSAYDRFMIGGVSFEPHKRLWRSWAPLKAKFFVWLVLWNRCWTSDRLQRRGLPHPESCPLCDQSAEDINHIMLSCVFTREVWFLMLSWVGMGQLASVSDDESFQLWWGRLARRLDKDQRKAFNTLVILVAWEIWKHRNGVVFDAQQPHVQHLVQEIKEEAQAWARADAKKIKAAHIGSIFDRGL